MSNANDVVPAEYVIFIMNDKGEKGYYESETVYSSGDRSLYLADDKDDAYAFPSMNAAQKYEEFLTSPEAKVGKIIYSEVMRK